MGTAKGVGGIVHHFDLMFLRDGLDGFRVARSPPHMDADDAGYARGDETINRFRGDIVGCRIHVRKHRCDSLPLQRVGRGDEGISRHNHFTMQPQGADGNFQSDRGIAHRHAMLHANMLCNSLFKFLNQWPIVREPSSVKYFVHTPQHGLAVA